MFDPILLAALITTVLLGCAILRVLRSERRRADLESRLSAIAMTAFSADGPVVSLRRSRPQRKALPIVLSRRLDLAFAATGNRIRPAHLVATVLRESFARASVGLAAGLVLAGVITRLLSTMIHGVTALDPFSNVAA